MKNIKKSKLAVKSERIKILAGLELERVVAGIKETGEAESIIYWCPGNTSIQRSCSTCQ